ncbi:hypothetical protein OG767_18785 [Micromonospora sp. NBC_01392]|uniref:hypothetical protein n=1 Tax=Micromonospora sp. NBC_01392 TaxID=2903588 RepID=UPI00324DEDBA
MSRNSPALGFLLCLLIGGAPLLLGVMAARRGKRKLRTTPGGGDGTPLVTFEGFTAGLGARADASRIHAVMRVFAEHLAVTRSLMAGGRLVTDRLAAGDILSVREDEFHMTGLAGTVADRNVRHPVSRLLGASNMLPGVLLRTRRGDLVFVVERKDQIRRREVYLAVSALIGQQPH